MKEVDDLLDAWSDMVLSIRSARFATPLELREAMQRVIAAEVRMDRAVAQLTMRLAEVGAESSGEAT